MMRLVRWQRLALGLAFSLPFVGGWLAGVWLPLVLTTVAVVGWVGSRPRSWDMGTPMLILWSVGAAWLAGQDVAVGWLLAGLAAALAVWDLDELQHLAAGDAVDAAGLAALLDDHLRWLGGALALGGALSAFPLLLHIRLNFGFLFLAALILLLALGRAWRQLPR